MTHISRIDAPADIAVLKFGGQTLQSPERRLLAARLIEKKLQSRQQVVAVVSAMGRAGDPYATDTLLSLLPNRTTAPADIDLLLSCGEIVSAAVMASILQSRGWRCRALRGGDAGILTDGTHGDARIRFVNPRLLKQMLKIHDCVVVAGFQGIAENGDITCLGRGGSDVSALALAAALGSKEVEIITDTPGVYTSDPNLVENVRHISRLSAEEIREMAWEGAKIVHPRAAELSCLFHIPVWVRDLVDEEKKTRIEACIPIEKGNVVTGIAVRQPVSQLRLLFDPAIPDQEETERLFNRIGSAGISMDMFNIGHGCVMFTVRVEDTEPCLRILDQVPCTVEVVRDCAKVSIVGAGMHGQPGVMARFVAALNRKKIRILQTVDSHATISALIPAAGIRDAVNVLHLEFELLDEPVRSDSQIADTCTID